MIGVIIIVLLLTLLFIFGMRNDGYWAKKGVKHDRPYPFVGNNFDFFRQAKSLSDQINKMYLKYPNEKLVGFYAGTKITLIVRDPLIAKRMLTTDFLFNYGRGLNPHLDVIEPMLKNLFFADGDLWKLLRQRMTPAFTSGKLKGMFPLIVERAERLQKSADIAVNSGKDVNVKDLMARYTTDFIGACGFGIDTDSLMDENSQFRKLGKRIFTITPYDASKAALKSFFPDIFKHMDFLDPSIEKNTVSLVENIIKERNYKPSGRGDFIDLLLELKEKGKVEGESIEHINPDGTPKKVELELDNLLLAAQVFVFFAAGFETSSSATSFTLHQLAFHPEVQEKCQKEVDEVLHRYNNKLCYEAVKEMKYLEMAFKEGLRMFPPLGFLIRKCERTYAVPDTDLTIDEGVLILIPLQGYQNDEKYFDSPKEFRPERFHPEEDKDIPKHVYFPFGAGPRACIGERLGLMQSLAGLAALLHKFSVSPCAKTLRYPIPDPTTTVVQSIQGGLPLTLRRREK